jgi:hypothetical protein
MSAKFSFTEYNIDHCWYGSKRNKAVDPDALYSLFYSFDKWVMGAPHITHTHVTGVDTKSYHVYVKDVAHLEGDFMAILWLSNASLTKSNKVVGLKLSDKPGASASIDTTNLKTGFLPGLPVYFYICSKTSQLYTVKPEGSIVTGRQQFDACIRYFMTYHSDKLPKTIETLPSGEKLVTISNKDSEGNTLSPNFVTSLETTKALRSKIESKAGDVRKLIHTMSTARKTKDEKKSIFDWIMTYTDMKISDAEIEEAQRIKYEVDICLTKEHIKDILDKQANAKKGERFGFRLKNSNATIWADEHISRREIDVPIKEEVVYTASSLLSAIEKVRASVVK